MCFRPLQIFEPENNPAPNIQGLNLFPYHSIRMENLSSDLIEKIVPMDEVRRRVPPLRPQPPVFGRRALNSDEPIVLDSPVRVPVETSHIHMLNFPASSDTSPTTSPVNTQTKRPAPSPPQVRESQLYSPAG